MNRNALNARTLLAALLVACVSAAHAKDPRNASARIILNAPAPHVSSITPPPKEWAMWPQDDQSQTAQPQQPPAQNANAANKQNASQPATGTGEATGSVVSAANVHTHPARELPLLWILLTGALSLGAAAACGSLILQKDEGVAETDVPVVSDHQEVTA